MSKLEVTYRKVADLIPYARNARTHSPEQVARIAGSIKEFGWTNPILVDGENGIVAGHGRLAAAQKLKMTEVPCIELSGLTKTQKRAYILADNKLALDSGWDEELLRVELDELKSEGVELNDIGFSEEELTNLVSSNTNENQDDKYGEHQGSGDLVKRYIVPPFTVLDSRQGYWQERAREWDAKIGDYGKSREETLFHEGVLTKEKGLASVSLLDPVLAEIICHWFLPTGGASKCCDPFAGDTVFGYVCASKGNTFTGIELREEQARLNNERTSDFDAKYICDDGRNIAKHLQPESQDLVFSCPPYFDLEKYSDLPNDASNQDWDGFCSILHDALAGAVSCLKPNRFAVVVMSNVRGKDGFYLDICEQIKRTMAEVGARLYNEMILVNVVGSCALRAHNTFRNRKVARTHQEVLVFFKGDPKNISKDYAPIELPEDAA